jgi:hypothetical protein
LWSLCVSSPNFSEELEILLPTATPKKQSLCSEAAIMMISAAGKEIFFRSPALVMDTAMIRMKKIIQKYMLVFFPFEVFLP